MISSISTPSSPFPTTLHEIWNLEGERIRVLNLASIPCTPPALCTEVILFIPGNPGIVDFYREFLETVWIQSHGRRTIYCRKFSLQYRNL